MQLTLLGTGDTLGTPVPLCDCVGCQNAPRRRRPALLVEHDDTTLLFDAGPDIFEQLVHTNTRSVDECFLTHGHDDHAAGVVDLHKLSAFTDATVSVAAEEAVWDHVDETFPWVGLSRREIAPGTVSTHGSLRIEAFRIDHSDLFPELGFAVSDGDATVGYAPDVFSLPNTEPIDSADLLIVDGLYLIETVFEDDDHAGPERLRAAIESVNADRVVLVNVSEHHHRCTTDEFVEAVQPYEVWRDFDQLRL